MRWQHLLLLVILLLGLLLRIHNLDSPDISFDESVSITLAKKPLNKEFIEANILFDAHPPLYFLVLHFWPDTELWEFRIPSVIFSVLIILFVYLSTRLVFDDLTALVAALITAMSSLHVEMAQFIRMYSFFSLIILVSFYFFLKALQDKKYWTYYTISLIIGFYTDPYTLLWVIALSTYIILRRKDFSGFAKSTTSALLISIPSFILTYITAKNFVIFSTPANKFWALLIIPYNYFVFIFGNFTPYLQEINISMIYLPILMFGLAFYLFFFLKGAKKLLYLAIIFIPVILLFLINLNSYIPLAPKRFLFMTFALYVIIAKGMTTLKNKSIFVAAILLIIVFSLISLNSYYDAFEENNPAWNALSTTIITNSQPGDIIAIAPNYASVPFLYYYKGELPLIQIPKNYNIFTTDRELIPITPYEHTVNSVNFLDELNVLKNFQRIWFIRNRAPTSDPKNILLSNLNANFQLIYTKKFSPDTTLYLYENKNINTVKKFLKK